MERLQLLHQFYEEDPNDPFNIYGLALEYQKHDKEKAESFFNKLLTDHPHYLPTYYHAGKFFELIDQKEKAIEVLTKGITLARETKEYKTLRELQSVYDELMFE